MTEARPQTGRFGAGVCPCPNLGRPESRDLKIWTPMGPTCHWEFDTSG
jgi:hypothetical protein